MFAKFKSNQIKSNYLFYHISCLQNSNQEKSITRLTTDYVGRLTKFYIHQLFVYEYMSNQARQTNNTYIWLLYVFTEHSIPIIAQAQLFSPTNYPHFMGTKLIHSPQTSEMWIISKLGRHAIIIGIEYIFKMTMP